MAQAVSSKDANTRTLLNRLGKEYNRYEYFLPDEQDNESPQGYIIEQNANYVLLAHFHAVDQFQVVLSGEGKLGKHPVALGSAHYADAYMPYGPIESYDEKLLYFTLRNQRDPGGPKFMPDSRDELKQGKKRRNAVAHQVTFCSDEDLQNSHLCTLEDLIEPHEDGLFIKKLTLSKNESLLGPHPEEGAGQYYLILNGSVLHEEKTYPSWSCIYVAADEKPLHVQAEDSGTEVIVLQFPKS